MGSRHITALLLFFIFAVQVSARNAVASAGLDVIMGDSIMTLLTGYPDLSPPNCVNMAVYGSTSALLPQLAPAAAALNPSNIFIMSGINDVNTHPATEVAYNFDSALSYFEKVIPSTQVYVQSILPVNWSDYPQFIQATNPAILQYNASIQSVTALHPNTTFLSYSSYFTDAAGNLHKADTGDGIHLNRTGLTVWNSIMNQYF